MLEALTSAAVLGIALLGLVQMHTASMKSTEAGEDIGRAMEMARQLGDQTATQPLEQIPAACGDPNLPLAGGPQGCRATLGPGTTFSTPRGAPCTQYVDEDVVVDATTGAITPVTLDQNGNPRRNHFRVDFRLTSHPNGGPNTAMVHVWVCWRDLSGKVNEVYTNRTKIRGVW